MEKPLIIITIILFVIPALECPYKKCTYSDDDLNGCKKKYHSEKEYHCKDFSNDHAQYGCFVPLRCQEGFGLEFGTYANRTLYPKCVECNDGLNNPLPCWTNDTSCKCSSVQKCGSRDLVEVTNGNSTHHALCRCDNLKGYYYPGDPDYTCYYVNCSPCHHKNCAGNGVLSATGNCIYPQGLTPTSEGITSSHSLSTTPPISTTTNTADNPNGNDSNLHALWILVLVAIILGCLWYRFKRKRGFQIPFSFRSFWGQSQEKPPDRIGGGSPEDLEMSETMLPKEPVSAPDGNVHTGEGARPSGERRRSSQSEAGPTEGQNNNHPQVQKSKGDTSSGGTTAVSAPDGIVHTGEGVGPSGERRRSSQSEAGSTGQITHHAEVQNAEGDTASRRTTREGPGPSGERRRSSQSEAGSTGGQITHLAEVHNSEGDTASCGTTGEVAGPSGERCRSSQSEAGPTEVQNTHPAEVHNSEGNIDSGGTTEWGMTDADRQRLKRNRLLILNQVRFKDVKDYLYQEGVLNNEDMNHCGNENITHQEQMRRLLDILPCRGPKAYTVFRSALQKIHYWVVDKLDSTTIRATTKINASTLERTNEL